ncbi:MAG: macro domain-containing protein, partial [Erysipelotrichaceae bacterium]|nr:macro domain-containing protein [Erysipelotrichaceae bacterium]
MSTIRIEKKNIVDAGTDCIVNAANEHLHGGSGVCGAIFKAAGWDQMQEACDKFGYCPTGSEITTPAFNINAKYVIHAVGPIWHGGDQNEAELLYKCYQQSLLRMHLNLCHSIAFPLISSGIYGYPVDQAWSIAIKACRDHLQKYYKKDITIIFCVLTDDMKAMGEKELERQIKADDNQGNGDHLLAELDGHLLKRTISFARKTERINTHLESDDIQSMFFNVPEYPKHMMDYLSLIGEDENYLKHYPYIKDIPPTEMTVPQIQTMLTYMKYHEEEEMGTIQHFVEDDTFLKMILRLDDLLIQYYKEHDLPVKWRYHNPLFWFEMDDNHNPVLVKGNIERYTWNEPVPDDITDEQARQGWQRKMLYKKYIGTDDYDDFDYWQDNAWGYMQDNGFEYTIMSPEVAVQL